MIQCRAWIDFYAFVLPIEIFDTFDLYWGGLISSTMNDTNPTSLHPFQSFHRGRVLVPLWTSPLVSTPFTEMATA
jgi:hypothetical protein